MEHIFDSEESSSSGCESGWTLYLQHSNIPHHDHHFSCKQTHDHQHEFDHDDEEEDDDDMSMVSDASSGPPHFQQQDDEDEYNNNIINGVFGHFSSKRRKVLKETSFHSCSRHLQDLPASLDDTASSPFFSFSNKDLKGCNKEALMEDDNSFDYSQGHSTNYFEMV